MNSLYLLNTFFSSILRYIYPRSTSLSPIHIRLSNLTFFVNMFQQTIHTIVSKGIIQNFLPPLFHWQDIFVTATSWRITCTCSANGCSTYAPEIVRSPCKSHQPNHHSQLSTQFHCIFGSSVEETTNPSMLRILRVSALAKFINSSIAFTFSPNFGHQPPVTWQNARALFIRESEFLCISPSKRLCNNYINNNMRRQM